jgi:hypothetical protein
MEEPRIYRLTLDTVDAPNLQLIMYPGKLAAARAAVPKISPEGTGTEDDDEEQDGMLDLDGDGTKEPTIDPTRAESLNILADLVELSQAPAASVAKRP